MMKSDKEEKVVIIGGVGTALNIIEQILDARALYSLPINLTGIILDSHEKGSRIHGITVVGGLEVIPTFLEDRSIKFLYALYKQDKMKERYHLMETLNIPLERYTNFVHPLSYVAGSLIMGKGNVILSNSTVQSNVIMGHLNIINSNVVIEHDTKIGNGNFFAAGSCVGSNVHINDHCFIGLNSTLRENIVLGNNVFVGMHSAVLTNFNNVVIAGVPAKQLKK
jgi:sugar O-acyltransferase (sialic acid O-acetyltransferase NeuD family)